LLPSLWSWGEGVFTLGLSPICLQQQVTVWIYFWIQYWENKFLKMRNKLSPIQPIWQIGEGF
jgi:hypothetical protein